MLYLISENEITKSIPKKVKGFKDKIRFEACIQTAGDINRNKRRYKKELIESGLSKVNPRISEGSFLGELDHPIDKNPVRQITVEYKSVSHRFKELGWDGDKLIAVVETLRTPYGTILKNLAEDGIPVGFSFRGMGELKQVHEAQGSFFDVNPPLHIITWDSVSQPSHTKAKLIKITESVNNVLQESVGYTECNTGFIKTSDGVCYLPNDFDQLVEQQIIKLKSKFEIHKKLRTFGEF